MKSSHVLSLSLPRVVAGIDESCEVAIGILELSIWTNLVGHLLEIVLGNLVEFGLSGSSLYDLRFKYVCQIYN